MGYLVWLFMASVAFSFYDAYRFIQHKGNLKRGIKVGSSILSQDKIQYFKSLKKDVINEETNAVNICPEELTAAIMRGISNAKYSIQTNSLKIIDVYEAA